MPQGAKGLKLQAGLKVKGLWQAFRTLMGSSASRSPLSRLNRHVYRGLLAGLES